MRSSTDCFDMFMDPGAVPPTFGVACADGTRIYALSTDSAEVARLVERWNRLGLSPTHLRDAVEDFRHT